jgi:hypothetical protein
MIMKKLGLLALCIAALGVVGCSDPCGDLKDCCVASIDAAKLDGDVKAQAQKTCDAYDNADSDACQTVIDAYTPPAGADVPAECKF